MEMYIDRVPFANYNRTDHHISRLDSKVPLDLAYAVLQRMLLVTAPLVRRSRNRLGQTHSSLAIWFLILPACLDVFAKSVLVANIGRGIRMFDGSLAVSVPTPLVAP